MLAGLFKLEGCPSVGVTGRVDLLTGRVLEVDSIEVGTDTFLDMTCDTCVIHVVPSFHPSMYIQSFAISQCVYEID